MVNVYVTVCAYKLDYGNCEWWNSLSFDVKEFQVWTMVKMNIRNENIEKKGMGSNMRYERDVKVL